MANIDTGIAMVRNGILDRLRAATVEGGTIVGVYINDGQITDGKQIPTDAAGNMIPYICVVFGGRGPVALRSSGIVSSRKDLKQLNFGTELYSKNASELHDFEDRVYDILEGFEPPNAGEIHGTNSGKIQNPADVKQGHSREGIGLIFECKVGTITPVDSDTIAP